MGECCLRGFRWNAQPTGKEGRVGSNDTYITGSNGHAAVIIVADLYGWKFPNTRLLADHYAEEADVMVFLPDFLGGEELPYDILSQPDRKDWDKLDLEGFISRNTKEIREPEILAVSKDLKTQYKRLGAVGFCYGGWAVMRLGSTDQNGLIDCVSTAHPTFVEKGEIDRIGVPIQVMAPEYDDQFTEELKQYATSTIPKLGVPFDYQYFPGLQHAFAIRGDPGNNPEQRGMERAKNFTVLWLREWLHKSED